LVAWWPPATMMVDPAFMPVLFLTGGTAVFLAATFLCAFALTPLAYLEQTLIPNVMDGVRRDRWLHVGVYAISLWVLLSYACAAFSGSVVDGHNRVGILLVWLVLLGFAIDLLQLMWRRISHFLHPAYAVNRFSNSAIHAIQNDRYPQLLADMDSLAEIGVRAVEKSKLALSTQTVQAFPPIVKVFLESAKSISHTVHDVQGEASGGDIESFTIFYLLQRLELIHDQALRNRQETVSRQMVMAMGKIIVQCGRLDLSMVAFPTHFLTKFGLKAQQHHFDEVAVLTTSTLVEVAKTLLTEIDITYAELQEAFGAIITGLDAIAKETFKRRKDTPIRVLTQPLLDIKSFFQTEKMATHRDTPVILQILDQLLEEYTVLEQVMQTMPSISNLSAPGESESIA